MAIQNRRGVYNDFDPSKMVEGEFAVVKSGDPNTNDGTSVYIATNTGSVKRVALFEDIVQEIESATEEVVQDFVEQVSGDVERAEAAAETAEEAASTFTVDSELSNSSTHPVQNKVINSEITALKEDLGELPSIRNTAASGIDLDISDGSGNVIARFSDGHIQTKKFNSAELKSTVEPTNAVDVDLDISDEQGYSIVRFSDGGIKTKNFDSADVGVRLGEAEESIEVLQDAIGSGYVIPNYWVDYMTAKEATINDLNMALVSGESFIFMTDYHQTTNNKKSMPLIMHILEHTSVTDVIYGGDTTDGGTLPTPAAAKAAVRTFANTFRAAKIKPVRGNHDCEPSAFQTINQIPDEAWYDLLVRPIENEIISDNKPYFYYDNQNQKIRHIIMDSGGMNDALTTAQLSWLKDKLTELDSGWTVFIYQHMVLEKNTSAQTVHLIERGTKTLNAIGEVYENLNCIIGAFICGHMHLDAVVDTDYNFKIIATTCDSGGGNSASDWNNPTRDPGTTNEQAFDVFSVDTTTKTIYITRIGAGSDRTVTY